MRRRQLPVWGWRLGRGCGGPVEPKQGSAHRRDDGGGFVRAGRAHRVWRHRRRSTRGRHASPDRERRGDPGDTRGCQRAGGHSRRRGRDSGSRSHPAPLVKRPRRRPRPSRWCPIDIYFEPSEVTIPANTDVTVNLPNEGVTPHNFSIDALGIDVDIAPGATEQVVINAPAGEYEYYCNVPGHKQAGMVGTLIVSEDAAAAPAGAATPAVLRPGPRRNSRRAGSDGRLRPRRPPPRPVRQRPSGRRTNRRVSSRTTSTSSRKRSRSRPTRTSPS